MVPVVQVGPLAVGEGAGGNQKALRAANQEPAPVVGHRQVGPPEGHGGQYHRGVYELDQDLGAVGGHRGQQRGRRVGRRGHHHGISGHSPAVGRADRPAVGHPVEGYHRRISADPVAESPGQGGDHLPHAIPGGVEHGGRRVD